MSPAAEECVLHVIALHGWGGEAAQWAPWIEASDRLGWRWHCSERGYGVQPPISADWPPAGPGAAGRPPPRLLISHSLGLHLASPALLRAAGGVVLLAGFGRFLPPGRAGRPLRVALQGMAAGLEDGTTEEQRARSAQRLLQRFLATAAAPEPLEAMPPGPADRPIPAAQRRRLRRDLALLEGTAGLPDGFPRSVPLLLVEAGEDRIVAPETRAALRQDLPQAERISLPGAGHALLRTPVIPMVLDWARRRLVP